MGNGSPSPEPVREEVGFLRRDRVPPGMIHLGHLGPRGSQSGPSPLSEREGDGRIELAMSPKDGEIQGWVTLDRCLEYGIDRGDAGKEPREIDHPLDLSQAGEPPRHRHCATLRKAAENSRSRLSAQKGGQAGEKPIEVSQAGSEGFRNDAILLDVAVPGPTWAIPPGGAGKGGSRGNQRPALRKEGGEPLEVVLR